MSADKTLGWSCTEDPTAEDETAAQVRIHRLGLGITPVPSGTGAALRMLVTSVGTKFVVEVGTGTGVSGLWLLDGMDTDGVLTAIGVEPGPQYEMRHAFDRVGYPPPCIRVIQRWVSDAIPWAATHSHDMVVPDVAPKGMILLASNALRVLRSDGIPAVARALWDDHVVDSTRRDVTTVVARELDKALYASRAPLTALLPVGDGLLVSVRQT